MESLRPEFALYGSKNKCARTDTALFPISQICTRGVTLHKSFVHTNNKCLAKVLVRSVLIIIFFWLRALGGGVKQ